MVIEWDERLIEREREGKEVGRERERKKIKDRGRQGMIGLERMKVKEVIV